MTLEEVNKKLTSLDKKHKGVLSTRCFYFNEMLKAYSNLYSVHRSNLAPSTVVSHEVESELTQFAFNIEILAAKCRKYGYRTHRTLCELFNSPGVIEQIVTSSFNPVSDALIAYIRKKKIHSQLLSLSRSYLFNTVNQSNLLNRSLAWQNFAEQKGIDYPVEAFEMLLATMIADISEYSWKYEINYYIHTSPDQKRLRTHSTPADMGMHIGNIICNIGIDKIAALMDYDITNHNQWPFVGNSLDFAIEQLQKLLPNKAQASKMKLLGATEFRGISKYNLIRLAEVYNVVLKIKNKEYARNT